MSHCRVFSPSGAPVRIMYPNPRLRRPNESDEAFVARICDVDMQKDSNLAGVAFVDIPVSDVPTDRSQRYKWRIKDRGGRKGVEVDPTAPDPPTRVP